MNCIHKSETNDLKRQMMMVKLQAYSARSRCLLHIYIYTYSIYIYYPHRYCRMLTGEESQIGGDDDICVFDLVEGVKVCSELQSLRRRSRIFGFEFATI